MTRGTVACQAPLSMEFSRQEHWRGEDWASQGHPKRKPEIPVVTRESRRNWRKTTWFPPLGKMRRQWSASPVTCALTLTSLPFVNTVQPHRTVPPCPVSPEHRNCARWGCSAQQFTELPSCSRLPAPQAWEVQPSPVSGRRVHHVSDPLGQRRKGNWELVF